MSLAFPELQGTRPAADSGAAVQVLAPRHYQQQAVAVYEDAELLITAILPDARVEHVGASAVPGAYSTGRVDVCVAVPRESFDEALGVLREAGFVVETQDADWCALAAPERDGPLMLCLVESGSRHESLMRLRDALRADAPLLARYNALKIDAAARGDAAYRQAKAAFFESVPVSP
ncbi:MAG: GrpB family protein [Betaproteobacteria bacterium]